MQIRKFEVSDIEDLIEILKLNNQYGCPEVDGHDAMWRIQLCEAAVFLVCEINGKAVGLVRGVYDGSRALIHQLSVHPKYQRRGIGKTLVKEIAKEFRKKGAPSVSATVNQRSLKFWKKIGFKRVPVFLVLAYPVEKVLEPPAMKV
jgi:N-acetylglutamate synthase-like GNAT family acetyltransferase